MNRRLRASNWCLLLLAALSLDGCALFPQNSDTQLTGRREPRQQRESLLQAAWRGRPYNNLVEAFGAPKLVMNVPGYRQMKTSVVVYGSVDKVTNCIDAFTVVHGRTGELTVTDYFCR